MCQVGSEPFGIMSLTFREMTPDNTGGTAGGEDLRSYLVADFMDDHHGQLHLIGRRGHLGVQQDLLLHKDVQPPVLHGGVGMFGHRQQVWKPHTRARKSTRYAFSTNVSETKEATVAPTEWLLASEQIPFWVKIKLMSHFNNLPKNPFIPRTWMYGVCG